MPNYSLFYKIKTLRKSWYLNTGIHKCDKQQQGHCYRYATTVKYLIFTWLITYKGNENCMQNNVWKEANSGTVSWERTWHHDHCNQMAHKSSWHMNASDIHVARYRYPTFTLCACTVYAVYPPWGSAAQSTIRRRFQKLGDNWWWVRIIVSSKHNKTLNCWSIHLKHNVEIPPI